MSKKGRQKSAMYAISSTEIIDSFHFGALPSGGCGSSVPNTKRVQTQKGQMKPPTSARSSALKRRSARIALHAPVALSGEDRSQCSFTIGAKATGLNKHGAAIQVTRELLVGTTVLLRNKRGTQISARVVSQINAAEGLLRYGIEFVEQDTRAAGFWGITFPANA
jgi:hypothetical protein